MPRQQFVILSGQPATRDGAMAPLGRRRDLVASLAALNTAPESEGQDLLYGPGILIELPPGQDPVTQMLLTLTEEEIGWQVLMRVARKLQWKVMDTETGREFTPRGD